MDALSFFPFSTYAPSRETREKVGPIEFPVSLTADELRELISNGASTDLWHKLHNALSVLERGEPCCEEMIA